MAGTVHYLLFLFYLQRVPGLSFYQGSGGADEVVRLGALLQPSTVYCCISFLTFCVHSSLLSDCKRTVSSKFFDTQSLSISTEKLVVFFHVHFVLSRICCNKPPLFVKVFYLSRIGRIDMSCSAFGHPTLDTFLILSCFAMYSLRRSLLGNSFFVYDLWSKPRRVVSLFRSMAFRHVPISERGSVAVTAVWSECANVV